MILHFWRTWKTFWWGSANRSPKTSHVSLNLTPDPPKKQIRLADIFEGYRKGKLSWSQIVFNKETVDYLQKNLHTLLSNN